MAVVETSHKLQRSDTPVSNITIVALRQPETIDDPLTEVLRTGARELLAKAVEPNSYIAVASRSPRDEPCCLSIDDARYVSSSLRGFFKLLFTPTDYRNGELQ